MIVISEERLVMLTWWAVLKLVDQKTDTLLYTRVDELT